MMSSLPRSFQENINYAIILWALREKPAHGYELRKRIRDLVGVSIGFGSLYPMLYKMEKAKLIKSEKKRIGRRVRRVYKIGDRGLRFQKEMSARFRGFFSWMLGISATKKAAKSTR